MIEPLFNREVADGQDGSSCCIGVSTSRNSTRGNRRQKTFFCEDDYRYYIELMSQFTSEAGTEVWCYCLMPNQGHLVMAPSGEEGLRGALDEDHRRYRRHVNFWQGWRGHVWQERFHSFVMDEKYLLATVRYVERKLVVARLCRAPGDWKWPSAYAHLTAEDDGLVRVKPLLERVDDRAAYLSAQCNRLYESGGL